MKEPKATPPCDPALRSPRPCSAKPATQGEEESRAELPRRVLFSGTVPIDPHSLKRRKPTVNLDESTILSLLEDIPRRSQIGSQHEPDKD